MSKRYKAGTTAMGEIKNVIKAMNKAGIKELDDIKQYLLDTVKLSGNSKLYSTILAVVSAKTREKKIYFKSDTFNKPLKLYIPVTNKVLKCLTNDELYFQMLRTNFLKDSDLAESDKRLIADAHIVNITFASDNFQLLENKQAELGFIQDFDMNFSAICAQDVVGTERVPETIAAKENAGSFDFDEKRFEFFGNTDLCVICLAGTSDQAISERIANMKYLRATENGFTSGIRKVGPSTQVRYIYKECVPENFCPSYLLLPDTINSAFFIEVELDYNSLFEHLQDVVADKIQFPANMCYWDTLQACMDFLSAFALTSNVSPDEKNIIGDWIENYWLFKSAIVAIKSAYTKVEQILHEFLNTFLNNSELTRFITLADKARKVLNEFNDVKKVKDYNAAISFLRGLPFCQMIQRQLSTDLASIVTNVINVFTDISKGNKPEAVTSNVRSVANSIYALLPSDTMNDACFPFIAPRGGLTGNLIEFNGENDGIFAKAQSISKRVANQKKKDQKEIKESVGKLSTLRKRVAEYVGNYFVKRGNRKDDLSPMDKDQIAKMVAFWAGGIANEDEGAAFLSEMESATSARNKNKKWKENKLIETFAKEFKRSMTTYNSKKKKKRPIIVDSTFYDTADAMKMVFMDVIESNEVKVDSDEDDKEDDKMEVEENK